MTFLAWHFVGDRLRNGDPIPEVGVWEHWPHKLKLCPNEDDIKALRGGLHWSLDPWDALGYAPGPFLRLVAVKGSYITQMDKGCSHWRKTVAQMDATEMLRYFARTQAISVLEYWQSDPPEVVLEWLFTGDESLRVAADTVAWSAARAATESAAESAARSAAWAAARSAAESAAWAAAWSAARKEFTQLVHECFEDFL